MNDILTENKPATTRQTWAIFCASKFDVRNCNLTYNRASEILSGLNDPATKTAYLMILEGLPGAASKGKPGAVSSKKDWQAIYNEAKAAGLKAGNEVGCVPMTVIGRANPLDDSSPITNKWHVADGVCGFASVIVTPGTCSFAKWLKSKGLGSKHYYGGMSIWIGEHNQSMQRKEAHAHAMCEVFAKHGIECRSESRMD